MADITKTKLPLLNVFVIISCICVPVGEFAVSRFQIPEITNRLSAIEAARAADRELLVRIDERYSEMKRILERGNADLKRIVQSQAPKLPDS